MGRYGKVNNGIGSYTTKKSERRYRVVYKVNGKTRSVGGFKTHGAAVHFQKNNAADVHSGTWIDPAKGKKAFGEFATEWLVTKNDVRPNTHELYDWLLRVHICPTFEDVPLRNITTTSVRHWLAHLRKKPAPTASGRLSKSTVAKAYRLLSQIMKTAARERYIAANPCDVEGATKEDKPQLRVPTANDLTKLADAVGAIHAPYRMMVLVAGWGGLRWGEVTALKRKHVDVKQGCVHVQEQANEVDGRRLEITTPKTDAGIRTVFLPAAVMNALAVHMAEHVAVDADALLFKARRQPGKRAQNQDVNYVRRSRFRRDVWLPATKAAGCEGVRFHDLRHAAATLAAYTGATTKDLMAHMGHASPAAALRYQHATEDRQRAIARGLDDLMPAQATGTDNVVPLKRKD